MATVIACLIVAVILLALIAKEAHGDTEYWRDQTKFYIGLLDKERETNCDLWDALVNARDEIDRLRKKKREEDPWSTDADWWNR